MTSFLRGNVGSMQQQQQQQQLESWCRRRKRFVTAAN
jgi:hypothetical protein